MTRAELVQEITDRGYDYVSSARIGRFIDRCYRTICSRRDWPFLEAEVSGVGSVEVPDLRKILSVSANEEPLRGVDRRWLISTTPNLTDTGTATYWYLENQTLKVYPVDTATVTARYKKRPAKLADGDEPLIPEEWQYLIVDLAVIHCLKDDDEGEEARALRVEAEEGIREMAADLMGRDHQGPGFLARTGQPSDYL